MQTTLDDADVVPHFLLPTLGSGDTLRAFGSARFHDCHSMLMQAEWRWIPNRTFVDMALFYDAGKVAADWSALDFDGLEHDFGVGLRFHGPLTTPLRVDLAKGREGSASSGPVRRSSDSGVSSARTFPGSRRRGTARRARPVGPASIRWRRPTRSSTTTIRLRSSPIPNDASGVREWDINLLWDLGYNTFVETRRPDPERPRPQHQHHRRGARLELVHQPDPRPQRVDPRPARGPLTGDGPAPGRWTVDRAQVGGRGSGLHGARFARPPCGSSASTRRGYPEAATGAILVANKILLDARLLASGELPDHA